MTDFRALLRTLAQQNVEFIVVGGATAHGAARLTLDVDVVYRRSPENHERLIADLKPHSPYLRGAPSDLPFQWDTETIERGLNFTLSTALGDIDLLGEITGGGVYEDLAAHCIDIQLFGVTCRCLDLEHLILVKRAAGRPKDVEAIAELEALLEEDHRE